MSLQFQITLLIYISVLSKYMYQLLFFVDYPSQFLYIYIFYSILLSTTSHFYVHNCDLFLRPNNSFFWIENIEPLKCSKVFLRCLILVSYLSFMHKPVIYCWGALSQTNVQPLRYPSYFSFMYIPEVCCWGALSQMNSREGPCDFCLFLSDVPLSVLHVFC